MLSPELFDGDGILEDDETGVRTSRNEATYALFEYKSVIQYLVDMDSGLFTLTRQEYDQLPASLVEAQRILKRIQAKHAKRHANDKPRTPNDSDNA